MIPTNNDMEIRLGFNPQRGFTAVELIMVFAIIALVSVMAIPAALSSMRYATFNKAKANLQALHEDARSASQLDGADPFGVRIDVDNGVARGVLLKGNNEVSGTDRFFPASIVFLANDAPLSGSVEWWYSPVAGKVISSPSSTNSLGMVGLPDPDLTGIPKAITINHIQSQSVATGSPGLEISTRQGDIRAAIRIYPIGIMTITDAGSL